MRAVHVFVIGVCLAAVSTVPLTGCSSGGGGGGGRDGTDGNDNAAVNDNVAGNDNTAVTDLNLVEVPDPLSGDNPTYERVPADAPLPGESVDDSRFGTTQTRVTQDGGMRHEYSRFDPYNVDQSMILLTYLPDFDRRIYRTETAPYDQNENLVNRLPDIEEPRWDPQDPDLIWGLSELTIVTFNVQTGQTTTVKDFSEDPTIGPILAANPDIYRITTREEGETSTDKRYWGFMLQGDDRVDYRGRYLVCWDRDQDEVLGVYELAAEEAVIDWVGMSPLGNWFIVGGDFDNGGNIGPGLRIVNTAFTSPFHQLAHATAHADVGLDSDGNEVIVMQNSETDHIDLFPLEPDAEPIPLVNLFYDSESPIGFNCGIHVSCNVPGYCVVSTYIEPGLQEQNWLDRAITLVELDRSNPRVFYLAKVYGTTGAYWEETHATITNDGTRVLWATNWNENVGDESVWAMELDVPGGAN